MENLFIKNSSQDQEVLKGAKRFLDNIVSQITSAYSNIKHHTTENYKSSTRVEIGRAINPNCTHSFTVNSKGVITYTSDNTLFFKTNEKEHPDVVRLLKKYPKSTRYKNSSDFCLVVEIENEVDFVNKVKDIVFMLEKGGFVLRR